MSLYLIFGIPAGLWLASLVGCGLAFRWSYRSISRRFLPAVILSVLAIAIGCLGLKLFHIYSISTFNGHEYRSFDSNWLFTSSLILGVLTLAHTLWKKEKSRLADSMFLGYHQLSLKKIIIIGAGLAILILISALSWQHFRHQRDANIRQKVCGSWRTSNAKSSFMMIFAPDGSFWFGTSPYNDGFSGTWQVSDGFVFMTTTIFYANGRQSRIISHLRLKISRLDDHQFVCEQNRLDDHGQLARESDGSEEMSDTKRLSR